MKKSNFDPTYVQISKSEAVEILGITKEELDRRRESDARCPKGFKDREDWMAPIRFRLSDIYTYSEAIMKDALLTSTEPAVNKE